MKGRHRSDEEVLAAVRDAVDAGETDLLDGGVTIESVAKRTGHAVATAEHRLRELARDGKLVRVRGANPETYEPRWTYLPPDSLDDDADITVDS